MTREKFFFNEKNLHSLLHLVLNCWRGKVWTDYLRLFYSLMTFWRNLLHVVAHRWVRSPKTSGLRQLILRFMAVTIFTCFVNAACNSQMFTNKNTRLRKQTNTFFNVQRRNFEKKKTFLNRQEIHHKRYTGQFFRS